MPSASAESAAPTEVVVRGERVPALSLTGSSVSIISRPMIESLPGGDTQPLPNILVTQPGFVYDTFGLLHTRAADGGISYVIDGIPLLTIPIGQFGNFIPTRLVQEMRVITGGFPAEYGFGMGAVVDVTTRHAIGGAAGQAQVVYGTYQTVIPSFSYSQEFGKVSLVVGGNLETTDRGLDPPSASPILHDSMLTGTFFARADYLFNSQDRLELLSAFTQTHYEIPIDPTLLPLSAAPPGSVRGSDSYGNPPPQFVPYDANPTEDERDLLVAASYTHPTSAGATLQLAPYVHTVYGGLFCDPVGSLGPTADAGSTCANVTRNVVHEGVAADYAWTSGFNQTWKIGTLLDVAEGHDTYASFVRSAASPQGGPDPALTLAGQDSTNVLMAGVYAQDEIRLGKWTLFPGVRLDTQRAAYLETSESDLQLVGPSARLAISYSISKNVVVRAFGGYVWQPPIAVDGPAAARILEPSLAHQLIAVDLKAETDWTGEVGVAAHPLSNLNLGLVAWGRLTKDQLDRQTVGNTNLYVSYNFARGRAAGVEASGVFAMGHWLDVFANGGWQMGQGQGVASETYLFTPAEVADNSWVTLDHVQTWTLSSGIDLHESGGATHLSGLVNYGTGMRTGFYDQNHVPAHSTLDITLRHTFNVLSHPEVAIDVFNVFDEVYASRLGNGYIGSAYGALRHGDIRITVPFVL
jgi:outer membrane receptor protein involved in Fe transport